LTLRLSSRQPRGSVGKKGRKWNSFPELFSQEEKGGQRPRRAAKKLMQKSAVHDWGKGKKEKKKLFPFLFRNTPGCGKRTRHSYKIPFYRISRTGEGGTSPDATSFSGRRGVPLSSGRGKKEFVILSLKERFGEGKKRGVIQRICRPGRESSRSR